MSRNPIILLTLLSTLVLSGCQKLQDIIGSLSSTQKSPPVAQQFTAPTIKPKLLNTPNMSQSALAVWANEAAVSTFSYDYVNYQYQLQQASQYFTPAAWKLFNDALSKSNTINNVINNKLVVGAVATGAPVITSQDVQNGRYTWNVSLPMLITYYGPKSRVKQNVVIDMIIIRSDKFIGKRGVAINSFKVSLAPGVTPQPKPGAPAQPQMQPNTTPNIPSDNRLAPPTPTAETPKQPKSEAPPLMQSAPVTTSTSI